jgi:glycosyltransferase involved in cell wall biosynthesis
MCWEKNIDGNIRVIKCLVNKGYDIEYDIYGFGPDLGQVYYLIDKYNLSKHIFVKGKVENDTYLKKLHEYDFYLQLSVLESLSISVIEAQSKGVPAIVSDSSGIIETIIPEVTGFALPYFNSELASEKIIDLVNNESKYQEFSIAAIQHVNSKFIDEIEVKKHIELYKKIIETV